jgi:hypothetical protein
MIRFETIARAGSPLDRLRNPMSRVSLRCSMDTRAAERAKRKRCMTVEEREFLRRVRQRNPGRQVPEGVVALLPTLKGFREVKEGAKRAAEREDGLWAVLNAHWTRTGSAVMTIDQLRYPRLHQIAQGAKWLATDEFQHLVAMGGGDLWETWLCFTAAHGGLSHYESRLKGPKGQCAIAFKEIAVAHFLVTECKVSILDWQPYGAPGKHGDFLVGRDAGHPVFVEVKSPRWEAEIARAHGQNHPRLNWPKYAGVEARYTDPWASVHDAVKKAYQQMPSDKPTLLMLNDDLFGPLADWAAMVHDIGLYTPKSKLKPEGGSFIDSRYQRLGAVGVLGVGVDTPFQGVRYRLALFENPHAAPNSCVPPGLATGYPRYQGPGG